jgi:hypothetical protein
METNPCDLCVVQSMCRNGCDGFEIYIDYFIRSLGFHVLPKYNLGRQIKKRQEGTLRLGGIVDEANGTIWVDFDSGKIYKIVQIGPDAKTLYYSKEESPYGPARRKSMR